MAQVQAQIIGVNRSSAGSILHVYFRRAVEEAHIPGVTVEESFLASGDIAKYGADGSKRTDVILRLPGTGAIAAIWDWKVGNAHLTLARAQELVEYAEGTYGSPRLAHVIPVREIHVEIRTLPR